MRIARETGLVWLLTLAIWTVNVVWLLHDVRPPVWDMAMHQSYAFNYLPSGGLPDAGPAWRASGNYPPFVHLVIAACYLIAHPGPDVAAMANLAATLLLLWSVHGLATEFAGAVAARWACVLTALTPFLLWMSRETILDYWLSAWVAAALFVLYRSRDFSLRTPSLLLGATAALGMLTKWLFAGFLVLPLAVVCIRARIWRERERLINCLDALLIAAAVPAIWYLPNLSALPKYFLENARVGVREGEPPVFSFQSWIYYLRLLEGYQLFGVLFALLAVSVIFVMRRKLVRDGGLLAVAIAGGWLTVTLLRTKDPRFTMPLLGLLSVYPAAWIQSWGHGPAARLAAGALTGVLLLQAYAANFGVSWLPQEVVLVRGYQGALRWDWNLYLQHYFHILGPPRREDWKQDEILRRMADHARETGTPPALAIVPDLPRFSAANFQLFARLRGLNARVDHPQQAEGGIGSFDGYRYAVMKEGDQGMPWTTASSGALNRIIVDEHGIFLLLGLYPLPDGDTARLYYIRRGP